MIIRSEPLRQARGHRQHGGNALPERINVCATVFRLAMRFAQDIRVAILSYRSQALWLLGYPEAALTDTKNALGDAREIGQAATLMYALHMATYTAIYCGATPIWKALGIMHKGWILFLRGKASEAVPTITSGLSGFRSTGATQFAPLYLSYLAKAHAELGP